MLAVPFLQRTSRAYAEGSRNNISGFHSTLDLIEGNALGIVEYGDIGMNVAARAHAMGMQVSASRRHVHAPVELPLTRVFTAGQLHDMLPLATTSFWQPR